MTTPQALALRVGQRLARYTPTGQWSHGIVIERHRSTFLVLFDDGAKHCYSYRMVWSLHVLA